MAANWLFWLTNFVVFSQSCLMAHLFVLPGTGSQSSLSHFTNYLESPDKAATRRTSNQLFREGAGVFMLRVAYLLHRQGSHGLWKTGHIEIASSRQRKRSEFHNIVENTGKTHGIWLGWLFFFCVFLNKEKNNL